MNASNFANTVAIDPSNPKILYVGGSGSNGTAEIVESTNSGTSWQDISVDSAGDSPHTSEHAMAFDASGNLLVGNDGGIWRLQTSGTSFNWQDINGSGTNTLNIALFNDVALDPQDPNTVYGTVQGMGTIEYSGQSVWSMIQASPKTSGTLAGGTVLVNQSSPQTIITAAATGTVNLTRSVDGGKTFQPAQTGINPTDPTAPIPALAADPSNPSHLLFGTINAWSSNDDATTWSINFPDDGSTIQSISISPVNSQTVYETTNDSLLANPAEVWVSQNGGNSFTQVMIPGSPKALTQIIADPLNQGTAYVVSASYSGGGIWETTNFGQTWTNISGSGASGLPKIPVYSIALDDTQNRIFVGTENGVYSTSNGGSTWAPFMTGMPNVAVTSLAINTTSLDILLAGTHGRGAYEIYTTPKLTVTPSPLQGVEGLPITAPNEPTDNGLPLIATFSDPSAPATVAGAANYTATIQWGDGNTTTGSNLTIAPLNDGSGDYGVFATHTYAEETQAPETVNITVSSTSGVVPSTGSTTVMVADAPLTALTNVLPIQATLGLPLNPSPSEVGSFTDANPNAPLSDFKAMINWGDGTTASAGSITQPGGVGTPFIVSGGHIYSTISGNDTITVTVNDVGGASTFLTNSASVVDAPLTPFPNVTAPQMTISVFAGGTTSKVIGEFTSANPNAVASQFQATVNWGDGSAPVVLPAGDLIKKGTQFVISAIPPYAHAGTDTITINVVDVGVNGNLVNGATTTLTTLANVTALPITTSTTVVSFPLTATEGLSSFFTKIATVTSSNSQALASDYQAPIIQWGDSANSTSAGTLTLIGPGKFAVSAQFTYPEEGQYTYTITIQSAGSTGPAITSFNTVTVNDAPVTVTPVAQVALAGQTISGTLATFVDSNLQAPLGDFSAIINWGDGTQTLGTITKPPGGTGFVVSANAANNNTHAYAQAGVFPLSVTVNDVGGSIDTEATTATITEGTFSVTGQPIQPINEGNALTGTVALLNSGNPQAVPAEYVATINWGDGSFSSGTLVNQGNGVFTISNPAGHVYAAEGTYGITVSAVSISTGTTTSGSTSVTVNDAPIVAGTITESPLQGVAGVTAASGPLLTFAQYVGTPPADFTVSINWGDGHVSAGTVTIGPAGAFVVSGSNLYQTPGNYTPQVTISDVAGTHATLTGSVVVTDPPISSTSTAITAIKGQRFSGQIATFTDPNQNYPAGNFQATINWGDGTSQTLGTITGSNGSFVVNGVHTFNTVAAATPVTVTIVNLNGFSSTSSVGFAHVVAALTGSLSSATDTGASNHDGITRVTDPVFTGTGDPGATVVLYAAAAGNLSAKTKVGTAIVNPTGHWSVTISPLGAGVYAITASMFNTTGGALEASGQLATGSISEALIIARTGPTVASTSLTPSTGTLHVIFQMGPASMVLSSLMNASNYIFDKINATTGALTALTPTRLTAALLPNSQVEVNLTYAGGKVLANGGYVVTLLADNLTDQAGNPLVETRLVTFPQATNAPNPNYVAEIDIVNGKAGAPYQYVSLAEKKAAAAYVSGGTKGTIVIRVPAPKVIKPSVFRF